MKGKMFLAALGIVASVAVIAGWQDPSFEFPGAKHVGYELQNVNTVSGQSVSAPPVIPAVLSTDDRITVSFKNATAGEVLDWLQSRGINFVVADNQVDRSAKVNINVVNVPVEELMQVLAGVWGGHFEKKGSVWQFKSGTGLYRSSDPAVAPGVPGRVRVESEMTHVAPPVALAPGAPPLIGQYRVAPLSPAQKRAMEKAFGDSKNWKEFEKNMEKWSEEFEKHFSQSYKFDEKQGKVRISQDGKTFVVPKGGAYYFNQKDFKPMNERELAKLQEDAKRIAEEARKMGKAYIWQKDFSDKDLRRIELDAQKMAEEAKKIGAKGFMFDGKTYKPLNEKDMERFHIDARKLAEEARKTAGNGAKVWVSPGAPAMPSPPRVSFGGSRVDLEGVYNSLTPIQEQKLKTQGFLYYSDLTAKQRGLIGTMGGGSWTLSYSDNGKSITIKSDK